MKQQICLILSGACLLALLAVGALAQGQEQEEAKKKAQIEDAKKKLAAEEAEVKFRGEVYKVMGLNGGFEMKSVKGAPYSATAEAETVQMLADGNRIRSKSTTTVYRDSEGRTRRENVGRESGIVTEVFINDPTSGIKYVLDPQRRVAMKSQLANLQMVELKEKIATDEAELKQIKQKMAVEAEMKQKMREAGAVEVQPLKKRRPVIESLGKQVIEGVECEGTRSTITIPAGQVGNDLPLDIVSEEWYSPALQVLVLTRHRDPRNGETTYRLININRSEPDRTLFEVPADYTVKDESAQPMKKRKPEEER